MSAVPLLTALAALTAIGTWSVPASRRFGRIGVPLVLVLVVLLVPVTLTLSHLVSGDAAVLVLVVVAAAAVGGAVVLVRTRRMGGDAALAAGIWLPALIGPAVWVTAVALAGVIPGASRLAWAMNGDGFNNLVVAQLLVANGGIVVGSQENAAPLTAAFVALSGVPAVGGELETGLVALATAWVVVIALWCAVSGAAVAPLVPDGRRGLIALASGAGSLLPLTGLLGGLPLEWGYLNAALAVPLVLLGWLLSVHSARSPLVSVCGLLGTASILLATWAPLAALPVAAALAVGVRVRSIRWSVRDIRVVVVAAALLPLVGLAAALTLPALFAQGSALATEGHGFPATWPVALLLLIGLPIAGRAFNQETWLPTLALSVGGAVSGGALLLLASSGQNPIDAYYPTKLSWLLVVALGTVALSIGVGALARLRRASVPAVAAASLIAIAVAVVAPDIAHLADRQPLAMVLGGRVWHGSDRAVDRILELSDSARPGLLWSSGDPDEGIIDFWVLVTQGGQIHGDPELRAIAFEAYQAQRDEGRWQGDDPEQLCLAIERIPGLVVHTADPGLVDALADCAAARETVITIG